MTFSEAQFALTRNGYGSIAAGELLFQASKFGSVRDGNVVVWASHRRSGHVRYDVVNDG